MQAIKLLSKLVEVAVVTELTGSMESKESQLNQNQIPLLYNLDPLQNPPKNVYYFCFCFFFLKEMVLEH